MASFGQHQHSSTDLQFCPSPPLMNGHPTPLMLTRDWLETGNYHSLGDYYFDFQSNHIDLTSLHHDPPSESPSLAGLGIRNIDLSADLDSTSCSLPGVATIFDDCPLPRPEYVFHGDLDLFAQGQSENDFSATRDAGFHSNSGTWSFSSVLKAAELVSNDSASVTVPDSSFNSMNVNSAVDTTHISGGLGSSDIALSFEELSASFGLSVADFAAQISATATVALNNMGGEGPVPEVSHEFGDTYNPFQFQSNINDITPKLIAPGVFFPPGSPVPRNFSSCWNDTSIGVNPADILPLHSQPTEIFMPSGQIIAQPTLETFGINDFADTPRTLHPLSLNVNNAELEADLAYTFLPLPPSQEARQFSDDEHSLFQSPSSSEYSPSLHAAELKKTLAARNGRSKISRGRIQVGHPPFPSPEPPSNYDESLLPPINLGTPVFDAHRGIDIEVLKAKAERYRLRNQGRDYDKRWLISFAGKLSPLGELVEEFRCYVTGCKQSNKRRDHILIHVGAHLDQRPFKCMYCSSRFLRKNECKRHELSHTGIRPFSCHLCPHPSTTFVRQDLLKRHMKRTHRIQLKPDKENVTPDRPKKRARC